MRTSKFGVFVRSCVVVFLIYMVLSMLWNWMSGTFFWTPFHMAVSAVITVAFFGGIAWVITNLGMFLIYGRNSEYQRYRQGGGDPFFDSFPRIFNPNESDWQFQCPVCGSLVENRIDVCGRCGYGSDGDSSAYFERYGDVKPPEMNDGEWEEIRRRHHV